MDAVLELFLVHMGGVLKLTYTTIWAKGTHHLQLFEVEKP